MLKDYILLAKLKSNAKKQAHSDSRLQERKKKYYVIRRQDPNVGIFSCILTFLSHLKYAEEKGFIPVIDMMNFDNEYLYPEEIGVKNAWEFYFEQPAGESLIQAYRSKRVILSSAHFKKGYIPSDNFLNSKESDDFAIWKKLWEKYIRFNESTLCYLKENYAKIIENVGKDAVLGVLCRGTDYFHHTNAQNVSGGGQKHIKLLIDKVKAVMLEKKCQYVFLATEDEDIFQLFLTIFKEKLLYIEDERLTSSEKSLLGIAWKREGIDLKRKGLNYILNFYILSQLNYFIGAKTSASIFLPIVSEMKYSFFYDLVNIEKVIQEENRDK